jgi:hypothetical protein
MLEALPTIGFLIGCAAGAVVFGFYGFCAWYLTLARIKKEPTNGRSKFIFSQMKKMSGRTVPRASVESMTFLWCIIGPAGAILWIVFARLILSNPPRWL